jgi:hypothetical protein
LLNFLEDIMKLKNSIKNIVAASFLVGASFAQAQIPVTDAISIGQQIIDYANQGLQYAELLDQYNQQLTDYSLELQNLAALPGTVRNQVSSRFNLQSASNLTDFGVSYGGSSMLLSPNTSTFYNQAETLLTNINGNVPQPITSLNTTLASLGLPTNNTNPVWQSGFSDRMKYEGLLDDYRANSLMRENASNRANEAKNVTAEMANLPANNTVGAIQLLAAQNALSYAQAEEVLKQQAIANRLTQQQQIDILSSRDAARTEKLKALQKQSNFISTVAMPY